jgi:hypothetical protein
MGHRNREGLKPARRQGCFEVVRGIKLTQCLLDADFPGCRRAYKDQRPRCTDGSAGRRGEGWVICQPLQQRMRIQQQGHTASGATVSAQGL